MNFIFMQNPARLNKFKTNWSSNFPLEKGKELEKEAPKSQKRSKDENHF